MTNEKLPTKSPIARFIEEKVSKSKYNIHDLAIMSGFTSSGIIHMFMSGDAKVPLDRVPALAGALDCDGGHLFVLALQQYFQPDVFAQVADYMIVDNLSSDEAAWMGAIRRFYGSELPMMTPSIEKKLGQVLKLVK